jgi:hypothetical protein
VWGAWLEQTVERATPGGFGLLGRTMMGKALGTQPRAREHEDTQEQEQVHLKSQKNPRHLKLGEGKLLYKEEERESKGLSSGWERRLNYPPPKVAVPFIIELKSRKVIHVKVTRAPTDPWVARQVREATPYGQTPTDLMRDNDRQFGPSFARRATTSGIKVLRTPYRTPRANAR